ncbi:MAG: ketoacyl-ACP synthase III [Candidatus Eisenbacteria bacterium]|nr:ketoacyl-ACP synthase III [Candidatus Eisenbacteria bacterium]
MTRSRITGIGFHVPPRVVSNHDLEKLMDTSDAWIVERTGIRTRHFADEGTGSSDLGVEAARRALADAGRAAEDVDFVIFATTTSDWMFPGNGVIVQERLGLATVGALDVRNACSGFVYALSVADAFVRMGRYRCVLVIGAEVQSTGLDLSTAGRDMAVLFGDGAGAAVVEPAAEDGGILSWALHSEGSMARDLWCEAPSSAAPGRITHAMLDEGRHHPRMNGRQVFKNATTRFPEVILEVLRDAGRSLEEVALVVPHQANQRIADAVAQRLGLPPEKVFQNIGRYGNTTAASIPIALTEARDAGLVRRGDLVVLAAFGAGFAWGACAMVW